MVLRSQELERLSGGRFNPAIGKLVELWGFHTSEYPIPGPPPDRREVQVLIDARPSSLDLEIDGDTVRSSNPAVQLDFGGIGKGFAIDLAIETIRRAGQESAIVNAGGDLRAIGNNLGKPWRIAVRAPGGGIAGAIEAGTDLAVFTSGNYERFREDAGTRYAHILDPRTGWPLSTISSATVVAADGATADAAATALVVAGTQDWKEVAASMGIKGALVIDERGGIYATPGMMEWFTPADGQEVSVMADENE
jgi:thiamine biosynthesis lipoprotein